MLTFLRGVAIAQIVQGVLEALIGFLLLVYGLFADAEEAAASLPNNPLADHITGYSLGVGLLLIALAALRLVAGIANWGFRGWGLGVASLFFGLVTVFSCYCSPTAVLLLGGGLFAYLNADVRRAFEMRREGVPPREVEDWLLRRGKPGTGAFD